MRLTRSRGTSRDSRPASSRKGSSTTLFSAVPAATALPNSSLTSAPSSSGTCKREGDVARKMIAADFDRGRQLHRFAEVADQFGGMRADIDNSDPAYAIFRQHAGVAGGNRFVDRFIERQMGQIDGAGQRGVLLRGNGDQVRIGDEARWPSSSADRGSLPDRPRRKPAGGRAASCGLPAAGRAWRAPWRGSHRAVRFRGGGRDPPGPCCWRRERKSRQCRRPRFRREFRPSLRPAPPRPGRFWTRPADRRCGSSTSRQPGEQPQPRKRSFSSSTSPMITRV